MGNAQLDSQTAAVIQAAGAGTREALRGGASLGGMPEGASTLTEKQVDSIITKTMESHGELATPELDADTMVDAGFLRDLGILPKTADRGDGRGSEGQFVKDGGENREESEELRSLKRAGITPDLMAKLQKAGLSDELEHALAPGQGAVDQRFDDLSARMDRLMQTGSRTGDREAGEPSGPSSKPSLADKVAGITKKLDSELGGDLAKELGSLLGELAEAADAPAEDAGAADEMAQLLVHDRLTKKYAGLDDRQTWRALAVKAREMHEGGVGKSYEAGFHGVLQAFDEAARVLDIPRLESAKSQQLSAAKKRGGPPPSENIGGQRVKEMTADQWEDAMIAAVDQKHMSNGRVDCTVELNRMRAQGLVKGLL